MYTSGMTTCDIKPHIENLYRFDALAELISRITDKILPLINDWQNRVLKEVYIVVLIDAIHYKERSEGRIISKGACCLRHQNCIF